MPRRKKEIKVPEPKQKPNGKWYIQLRLKDEGGKQKSVYILEETEAECRAKAIAIKAGYIERDSKQTVPKLKDVIDNYISSKDAVLSPSTIKGYKTIRDNRFTVYMDKPINKINWQKMINDETKSGKNPKTIHNSWSLVSASVEAETGNRPKVRLPQIAPNEHNFLTYEQIKVFLSAIKGKPVEIAALLGLNSLRVSEIKGLTWDNINLQKQEITVSGSMVYGEGNKLVYKTTNKNRTSNRIVPILFNELSDALSAVKHKQGYVVSLTEIQIYKAVNRICEENNLPQVGCHGLRHSFASACFYQNIPTDIIQKWGGWHELTTMKRIYTHVAESHSHSEAERFRKSFREQNATHNATKN